MCHPAARFCGVRERVLDALHQLSVEYATNRYELFLCNVGGNSVATHCLRKFETNCKLSHCGVSKAVLSRALCVKLCVRWACAIASFLAPEALKTETNCSHWQVASRCRIYKTPIQEWTCSRVATSLSTWMLRIPPKVAHSSKSLHFPVQIVPQNVLPQPYLREPRPIKLFLLLFSRVIKFAQPHILWISAKRESLHQHFQILPDEVSSQQSNLHC